MAASAAAMTFSADLYSSDGHNGKIYMDTDKIRVETKEMISITRLDKKLIWLLMPEEKMYMEQVLQSVAMNQKHLPANDSGASDVEREFILRETINGYAADKYKITINTQSSPYEGISSDPGITMAVKTAAIARVTGRLAQLLHPEHHRVLIAIHKNLLDELHMPGGFTFQPQTLA